MNSTARLRVPWYHPERQKWNSSDKDTQNEILSNRPDEFSVTQISLANHYSWHPHCPLPNLHLGIADTEVRSWEGTCAKLNVFHELQCLSSQTEKHESLYECHYTPTREFHYQLPLLTTSTDYLSWFSNDLWHLLEQNYLCTPITNNWCRLRYGPAITFAVEKLSENFTIRPVYFPQTRDLFDHSISWTGWFCRWMIPTMRDTALNVGLQYKPENVWSSTDKHCFPFFII